jgi:hypothetical protein
MLRFRVIILLTSVSATALFALPRWKRVTPGDHLHVLTDVAIADARTVLVTTSADILWRSVVSGKTFPVARYPLAMPLAGISFCDSLHGVAVGPNGAAARSTDGGETWSATEFYVLRTGAAVTVDGGLGRRVALLADTKLAEGHHALTLDASALPPGPYLLVVDAAGTRQSTRLLLVK